MSAPEVFLPRCTSCGTAPATHALPFATPPMMSLCAVCAACCAARRDYPDATVVPLGVGEVLSTR